MEVRSVLGDSWRRYTSTILVVISNGNEGIFQILEYGVEYSEALIPYPVQRIKH